jgi:hypothetical protein
LAKFCKNCGYELENEAVFCQRCGKQVQTNSAGSPKPKIVDHGAGDHRKNSGFPWVKMGLISLSTSIFVVCSAAVVVGILLRVSNPGMDAALIPGGSLANDQEDVETETELQDFSPRNTAPGETQPESKAITTTTEETVIELSDGTTLNLPPNSKPATVALAKTTNTIQLNSSGLETSGSMRTIEFDPAEIDETFVPMLTIPSLEMGDLEPGTVNVARVGDIKINGEVISDFLMFLPATLDSNGNLVVIDTVSNSLANDQAVTSSLGNGKLAAIKPQTGRKIQVRYVTMTYQQHLEWQVAPQLVRMIPDETLPEFRRMADPKKDEELLKKPVMNIIVLVHGHNEAEKDGSTAPSAPEPWKVDYKRDAWTEYYKAFTRDKKDQLDCTAFYEFIYPTYRPAYSPVEDSGEDTLGVTLAKALKYGASNDNHYLERIRKANLSANLVITAHSMGGLVSREAVRQFDGWLEDNFKQLATWGTPHHGSPLITLGYAINGPYKVKGGGDIITATAWLVGDSKNGEWVFEKFVQLDTPGERDLRWDNIQPLTFDTFLEINKYAIPKGQTAADYDLTKGPWLYNPNLAELNAKDPNANGERYYFLYGVTEKRFFEPFIFTQTALGASIMEKLIKDPDKAVPGIGGRAGNSDGAVPLASMAGLNIANFRSDYMGNIDHEEYFSASSEILYGVKVAKWTFDRLGLNKPRCTCATLEMTTPGDISGIALDADLDVTAQLKLDNDLDPKPGKRIDYAEAFFYISGTKDEFSLGNLDFEEDGSMEGKFSMPDIGEGNHQLVVRVHFTDGTVIETKPKEKALYQYALLLFHSNSLDDSCQLKNGQYTTGFGGFVEGFIENWNGEGDFNVTAINDSEKFKTTMQGGVSADGRKVSLAYEIIYDDPDGPDQEHDWIKGEVVNLPFKGQVEKNGESYDSFVFEGGIEQLKPFLKYWSQLSYNGEVTMEESIEDYVSCDSPGKIQVRLYTEIKNTPITDMR